MSTSDRELLEFAAKAAGIKHVDYSGIDYDGSSGLMVVDGVGRHLDLWSPLTDDGDALRLAVKLKLEILFFDGFGEIAVEHNNDGHLQVTEQYAEDMNAATRRAIVRAAAEIGRSMK